MKFDHERSDPSSARCSVGDVCCFSRRSFLDSSNAEAKAPTACFMAQGTAPGAMVLLAG